MTYTYTPKREYMAFLETLKRMTDISVHIHLDYAVELLLGEYDWDCDQCLENIRRFDRASSQPARLDPEERLCRIARDVHDSFFAEGTEWGSVDDIQHKLEAIYRPLVEEGYMRKDHPRHGGEDE